MLLHNSDRHHGNLLMGEHWVDGRQVEDGSWKGSLRPVLIDHAAAFRADAHVCMSHENAFQTGAVRRVSASTYLRLRFLDASAITARFSDFLTEREMRDLLHRRNNVLLYLDRLVESQVRAGTVCLLLSHALFTGLCRDGDRVLIPSAIHAVRRIMHPPHTTKHDSSMAN